MLVIHRDDGETVIFDQWQLHHSFFAALDRLDVSTAGAACIAGMAVYSRLIDRGLEP